MELYKGRPQELDGRTDRESKVYDLLDGLGIEYLRVDHEKAETMEACVEIDKTLGTAMCKNLFLCNRQKTQFYLLLMPGEKLFKTKELSAQLGCARLSFAGAEDMERLLGISPGSVSIMGLMNDKENAVQLIIDREIAENEYLGCHPCVNTSSIKIKTKDVFDKFLKNVCHDAITVDL